MYVIITPKHLTCSFLFYQLLDIHIAVISCSLFINVSTFLSHPTLIKKADGDWPFPNPEILLNVCPSTCTKGKTPQTNQYPMNNIHFAWWSNSSFQNQDILATNNQQVSDRHLHNMSQRMFTLRPSLILFHCPLSAIGPGENPWRAAALKLHDSSWGVRHVFGFEKSFVGLSKQITYQYWTKLPVHWLQKFHE